MTAQTVRALDTVVSSSRVVIMNVSEAAVVPLVMTVSSVVMSFIKDNVSPHVLQAYTR